MSVRFRLPEHSCGECGLYRVGSCLKPVKDPRFMRRWNRLKLQERDRVPACSAFETKPRQEVDE